jgi:hypothetical protein
VTYCPAQIPSNMVMTIAPSLCSSIAHHHGLGLEQRDTVKTLRARRSSLV